VANDINLKALDVVLDFALVELRYEVGLIRTFPAALQSVKHDTTELLDVMLLPGYTISTPSLQLPQF